MVMEELLFVLLQWLRLKTSFAKIRCWNALASLFTKMSLSTHLKYMRISDSFKV